MKAAADEFAKFHISVGSSGSVAISLGPPTPKERQAKSDLLKTKIFVDKVLRFGC